MRRREIIECARAYLGLAWGHQRRGPDAIDCVGLPILIARDLGLKPQSFDITGYSRRSNLYQLVGYFREHLIEKRKADRQPGDLLILRDRLFPCHCGIIGEKPYGQSLIHARAAVGKPPPGGAVREEPIDPDWTERITNCFEFPGVAP